MLTSLASSRGQKVEYSTSTPRVGEGLTTVRPARQKGGSEVHDLCEAQSSANRLRHAALSCAGANSGRSFRQRFRSVLRKAESRSARASSVASSSVQPTVK